MAETTSMEAALKLLDRQAYSEQQLRTKLTRAGFSNAAIEDCLLRLKTWGYINDSGFAENRIRSLQNRCKSREYVRCDLQANGVAGAVVAELLDLFYPRDMELEIARKVLQKRFRSALSAQHDTAGEDRRAAVKAAAALARAGFAEETIRQCFSDGNPAISST